MPKIYLINVGANTGDQRIARSPLFDDGRFVFVTFPDKDGSWQTPFPREAWPFVREPEKRTTHLDPDWDHLSYGDVCSNPRAGALTSVVENDILLFWALLWEIPDKDHNVFNVSKDSRKWCLIGALRVEQILESGESIAKLPKGSRERARHNAHVQGELVEGRKSVRVFLAHPKYSAKFDLAVDLGIDRADSLLRKTVYTADGKKIVWNSKPHWGSVTRTCRAILDLSIPENKNRAELLRRSIKRLNPNFDLLA